MLYIQSEKKAVLQSLLPKEFRKYRQAYALSQEQLARKLGISVRSYIDLEHGLFFPSATTLILFMLQLNDQELLSFLSAMAEVL